MRSFCQEATPPSTAYETEYKLWKDVADSPLPLFCDYCLLHALNHAYSLDIYLQSHGYILDGRFPQLGMGFNHHSS